MKIKLLVTTAAIAVSLGTAAMAVMDPMVGGAAMFDSKNIVRERGELEGPHHAGSGGQGCRPRLDARGPGPFTVFAPTNEAFAALPAGTVDTLLKPENKGTLTQVLTYHVVPGRYDKMALENAIKSAPGGRVALKTARARR